MSFNFYKWVYITYFNEIVQRIIELGYILRCEIFENAKISFPNEIPMAAYGVCKKTND